MDKNKKIEILTLKKEIEDLKSKMYYFAGSLETINYLLKLEEEENKENHLSHIKEMTNRISEEIKKDLTDFNQFNL